MIFNIIGQIVIGWLLADFLSGVFHWWQDRGPSVSARWVGAYLIAYSRLHHKVPGEFGDGDFWFRNTATFVGVGLTAIPLILIFGITPWSITAVIGGCLSTQVHYWAHFPSRAGPIVKLLQSSSIIQSPREHARHHRPPHQTHYCALTNFLNPLLDKLKVWNKLEMFCAFLGIKLSLGER